MAKDLFVLRRREKKKKTASGLIQGETKGLGKTHIAHGFDGFFFFFLGKFVPRADWSNGIWGNDRQRRSERMAIQSHECRL